MLRFLGVMDRSLRISWEGAKTLLVVAVGCCQEKLWKEPLKLGMSSCHQSTVMQRRGVSRGSRHGSAWQWDGKGERLGPGGGQSLCLEAAPESSVALLVCVSSSTFPSGTSVLSLKLFPRAGQSRYRPTKVIYSFLWPRVTFRLYSARFGHPYLLSPSLLLDVGNWSCC